jgi:ketosteroid isomerase-like protein
MQKVCITAVKTGPLLLGMALLFAAAGCQPAPPDAAAIAKAQAADEATIRQLDADWVKAGAAKNIDGWDAFYADDAVVLPPNEPIANDKAAIRRSVAGLLTLPGLSLSWQPTKVEVSKSGDLGYLHGTYQMSMNDNKGQPVHDTGKILEIWKKQPDGKWKCIVDTWNSDLPVPTSTAK